MSLHCLNILQWPPIRLAKILNTIYEWYVLIKFWPDYLSTHSTLLPISHIVATLGLLDIPYIPSNFLLESSSCISLCTCFYLISRVQLKYSPFREDLSPYQSLPSCSLLFSSVSFLPLMYLVKIILFIDMLFNKKKIYPVKYKPHEIREFYYIFHCYIPQIKRVVDSWEILVKSIKYLSDFIIKKLNMNAFF